MGKIKKGILGGFSGRVGNIIGGSWKGIDYMRSEATSIANPRTTKQVEVRDNFSVVGKLMSGAIQVLRASDWRKTRGNSAFSKGVQVNYKSAVIDGSVDFEKLNFGRFSRSGIVGMTASLSLVDTKPTLHIEGTRVVDSVSGFANDQLAVVICKTAPDGEEDPETVHTIVELDDGTTVDLDADLSSFIDGWDDQDVYVYVGVVPNNFSPVYGKVPASNDVVFAAKHLKS